MTQGPKLPSRPNVPRRRDHASRPRPKQASPAGGRDRTALLEIVRLLARQAAREFFNDTDAGESR